MSSLSEQLAGYHPVISCEGAAEEVIIKKLLDENRLVFPESEVIGVTRKRKASDIQEEFLGFEYDWPVCIIRVHDSCKEQFRLGNLYVSRFPVWSFTTHPEMEILVVLRENKWEKWRKSKKKPSDFCKQYLGMKRIKSTSFLTDYWNADSIAEAALEYRRKSKISSRELCLADLIRYS